MKVFESEKCVQALDPLLKDMLCSGHLENNSHDSTPKYSLIIRAEGKLHIKF